MNKSEAIEAINRLLEHAEETYPHFESPRGQQDIAAAKEAVDVLSYKASPVGTVAPPQAWSNRTGRTINGILP